MTIIEPDWPLGERVHAFATTRHGGVSEGAWASMNLGINSGDDSGGVTANRARLAAELPAEPRWLKQVHGASIIHLADWQPGIEADAAWTDRPGEVVVIQTADCLPILLADRDATVVAGVHGGWRSLAGGILSETLSALPVEVRELVAWIGPGICGRCYQVGADVREAFEVINPALLEAFEPDGDRWRADLKWIAAYQLRESGVEVFDCGRCTFEDVENLYSFRRDRRTGRMASVIWLKE